MRLQGLIPHPMVISRLCILGSVQGDWDEEENYPRTSPLTLTGITKGPKNRGREREAEAVREKEEPTGIQQPYLDREAPELQQRERSVSPSLTFSPKVRHFHKQHAESSEPLGNNVAMLEMIKSMRQ